MKVVIAGGSGFIGRYLLGSFRAQGHSVQVVSRGVGDLRWDNPAALTAALEGSDLVINLAGKSVNCRYNTRNREAILRSRVETTRLLGEAISRCRLPPLLWINASTATWYRDARDRPMTEKTGERGSGFSVEVASRWEEAFFRFRVSGVRQVALRTAIVLGKDGGALGPYRNLIRAGLGGRQGDGAQMFSWIHEADLRGIILFLGEHPDLEGIFNAAAPGAVTNRDFMKALRQVSGARIGIPSPGWVLKAGAALIGTETELVLKSRWVVPERLLDSGYRFRFPDLRAALAELWGQ
jgi:uncharacterized protein (TIGR01777 family)